jgi:hypothetical protein
MGEFYNKFCALKIRQDKIKNCELKEEFENAFKEYSGNANYDFIAGEFYKKKDFTTNKFNDERLDNIYSFCENYLLKPNNDFNMRPNSSRIDKFVTLELLVYENPEMADIKRIKNALGIANYCYGELMNKLGDSKEEILSKKIKYLRNYAKKKGIVKKGKKKLY